MQELYPLDALRLKLEFGVERIEPKEITVSAVLGRRARASLADALEIIPTLYRAIAVGHALYVKNIAQKAPLV